MVSARKFKVFAFAFFWLINFPQTALAKHQIEFTPSISIQETYDDNINLSSSNERSDYITVVSPRADLSIRSETRTLEFFYSPGFVRYEKESQDDTVRHDLSLYYKDQLTEHWTFELGETFRRSEDPIGKFQDEDIDRTTRNMYERNIFDVSLRYIFGPENNVKAGYRHDLLLNEDITLDDVVTHHPFVEFIHRFDEKNSLELEYNYKNEQFSRDDNLKPRENFVRHATGAKYLHRFSPSVETFVSYNFTTWDFKGLKEDNTIHEGSLGYNQSFSKDLSLSLEAGYFLQVFEESEDETGLKYSASMTRNFERGSFSLTGTGGWREDYLLEEQKGIIRYWSASTGLEYQILEALAGYGGVSYRTNKDLDNRKWNSWQGNLGLKWSFLRWYFLSLEYTYSQRDDDLDEKDYTDNRFMLMFSTSRLFKW